MSFFDHHMQASAFASFLAPMSAAVVSRHLRRLGLLEQVIKAAEVPYKAVDAFRQPDTLLEGVLGACVRHTPQVVSYSSEQEELNEGGSEQTADITYICDGERETIRCIHSYSRHEETSTLYVRSLTTGAQFEVVSPSSEDLEENFLLDDSHGTEQLMDIPLFRELAECGPDYPGSSVLDSMISDYAFSHFLRPSSLCHLSPDVRDIKPGRIGSPANQLSMSYSALLAVAGIRPNSLTVAETVRIGEEFVAQFHTFAEKYPDVVKSESFHANLANDLRSLKVSPTAVTYEHYRNVGIPPGDAADLHMTHLMNSLVHGGCPSSYRESVRIPQIAKTVRAAVKEGVSAETLLKTPVVDQWLKHAQSETADEPQAVVNALLLESRSAGVESRIAMNQPARANTL